MATSGADPKTIYGADARALQVSKDQGRSWELLGPAPEGLVDIAASSEAPSRLFAATQGGLLKSGDGGKVWQDAYWPRQPATMVHVTPGGVVHAFVVGTGLIESMEPKLTWRAINKSGFSDDYLLHFAVDPGNHSKFYAISFDPQSKAQAVLASDDAGKTWAPLGSAIN